MSNRLKKARMAAGFKTARIAAESLGKNYNTYAAHENGARGVPIPHAEQYARKFKVSLEWLLTGRGEDKADSVQMPISGTVPILGTVAAGIWQEIDAALDEPDGFIPYMPTLKHSQDSYFALVVRGKSMNKLFPDGSVLMCLDVAKSGIQIMENDIAIVERRKEQDGLREVTAKRVRRNGNNLELWPESTEMQFQTPLIINDSNKDVDVCIIARVVGVYSEM